MLKLGTFVIALATTGRAVNLNLELEAEIQALLEQENYADNTTEPCPFPDTKQFNTPEYLAQSASCKKR